jgi:predicted transcriptional regulator
MVDAKRGKTKPYSYVGVNLDLETSMELDRHAAALCTTRTVVIRDALKHWMAKLDRRNAKKADSRSA